MRCCLRKPRSKRVPRKPTLHKLTISWSAALHSPLVSYSLQDFEDNLGMIRFVRTLRDGAVAAGIYLSIKVMTSRLSTQESGRLADAVIRAM